MAPIEKSVGVFHFSDIILDIALSGET